MKPGPLDSAERRIIEKHPLIGYRLVGDIPFVQGRGVEVIRSHHERWDGLGYPDGLKGDRIPPAARIFHVADALDAMTDKRPYREAMRWADAVDEIVRLRETQFDPDVVDALDRGGAGDQGEPREQPADRRLDLLPADDLAVATDGVELVGVDGVASGAAEDGVARPSRAEIVSFPGPP